MKQRPALIVHARKGYTVPDASAKPAAQPALPEGVSVAARAALRNFTTTSGIDIALASATFRGVGEEGVVILDAQLRGGKLSLDSGERITLSYQVIDMDNRIVTRAYKAFTLDLRDSSRQEVAREGLRCVDRIVLKPGRYEIRFVADQPAVEVLGSLTTHVQVPEPKDSLSMSGVLVASLSTSGHRTLHRDEEIRERVSADPTPLRRFPQGDELVSTSNCTERAFAADGGAVTVSVIGRGRQSRGQGRWLRR